MVKTAEGIDIPGGGDLYDYTAEQRAMAASQRTVVPVANRAAAEVVAAAMATDGRSVSGANPLVVFRRDTERIEIKTDIGWGGPPQGVIAATESVSSSGAIAATAVVLNLPSVEVKAGRSYRVEAVGNYYVTSTGGTFAFTVGTCGVGEAASSTANIQTIASQADNPNAANEGRRFNIRTITRPTVGGVIQFKLLAQRVTGGASAVITGQTQDPVQFSVEDLGVTQGMV